MRGGPFSLYDSAVDPANTPLTIVLLTYGAQPERAEYAYRTLDAVLTYIRYDGPLFVHIADDGSPEEHCAKLVEIVRHYHFVRGLTVSNSGRAGYGASYNLATQAAHERGGCVLPLEDDWVIESLLPASLLVGCINEQIQCIRLGYLGWTQPMNATLIGSNGVTFWLLDPESPEPHVFAGHPRIETVDFERRVGEWPVGEAAGTTEFIVAHRPEARVGVAWPEGVAKFAHIGSIQAENELRQAVTA